MEFQGIVFIKWDIDPFQKFWNFWLEIAETSLYDAECALYNSKAMDRKGLVEVPLFKALAKIVYLIFKAFQWIIIVAKWLLYLIKQKSEEGSEVKYTGASLKFWRWKCHSIVYDKHSVTVMVR